MGRVEENQWLSMFFTIQSHKEKEKKNQKSYALLLTSKQVYKLIQRAVILKIFYV